MKKQKWYEIEDMDEFVSRIRQIVLDDFFANEDKEQKTDFTELFHENYNNLENKLTIGEAHNIIKSMVESKQTEIGTYQLIISAKNFVKRIDYLNRRIISNMLMELVSTDKIESAFDDKQNEFVFWRNDKLKTKKTIKKMSKKSQQPPI